MRRFKSPPNPKFPIGLGPIANLFRPRRHRMKANYYTYYTVPHAGTVEPRGVHRQRRWLTCCELLWERCGE
jgi:hypothetical protein